MRAPSESKILFLKRQQIDGEIRRAEGLAKASHAALIQARVQRERAAKWASQIRERLNSVRQTKGRLGSQLEKDDLIRAGGYGWRVGDEGSGYYVGRRALESALRHEDGRYHGSRFLRDAACGLFRIPDLQAHNINPILSEAGQDAVRAQIAALSHSVFEGALSGDREAQSILTEAVAELADHLRAVIRRMGAGQFTVALHGGMFNHPAAPTLLLDPLANHRFLMPYEKRLCFKLLGVDEALRMALLQTFSSHKDPGS